MCNRAATPAGQFVYDISVKPDGSHKQKRALIGLAKIYAANLMPLKSLQQRIRGTVHPEFAGKKILRPMRQVIQRRLGSRRRRRSHANRTITADNHQHVGLMQAIVKPFMRRLQACGRQRHLMMTALQSLRCGLARLGSLSCA